MDASTDAALVSFMPSCSEAAQFQQPTQRAANWFGARVPIRHCHSSLTRRWTSIRPSQCYHNQSNNHYHHYRRRHHCRSTSPHETVTHARVAFELRHGALTLAAATDVWCCRPLFLRRRPAANTYGTQHHLVSLNWHCTSIARTRTCASAPIAIPNVDARAFNASRHVTQIQSPSAASSFNNSLPYRMYSACTFCRPPHPFRVGENRVLQVRDAHT